MRVPAEEVPRAAPEQRLEPVASVFLAAAADADKERLVQAVPQMVGVGVIHAGRRGQRGRHRDGDRKDGDPQAHSLILG